MVTERKPGKLTSVAADIYKTGGLGKNGLYRGFTAQVARDAWGYRLFQYLNFILKCTFSIYFLPYIAILQFLEDRGQEKNSLGIVAAGAFSGVLSQG